MTSLLLALTLASAPIPSVGADVRVDVPTRGPVVTLVGGAVIDAEVTGDVVAVGGDVELLPGALVRGDVVALGGRVHGAGRVEGRTVCTATLGLGTLAPQARHPGAGETWGLRALRSGAWLLLVGVLALLAPAALRRAGAEAGQAPGSALAVGGLSVLAWVVLLVVALALGPRPLGVGLMLLAVVLFLAAKVAGIAAVAWLLGRALAPRLPVRLAAEAPRTGVAMLALLVVASLPLVGELIWLAANVLGIGGVVLARLVPARVAVAIPDALT